jgi:hypothetical protein
LKFKTLKLLLEDCKVQKNDDRCIYAILGKIGSAYSSAYSIFVSTFHSTKEALWVAYKPPTLEVFYDYLIREQDKLLHFGVINNLGTSNKALMAQEKDKYKHHKKQNPQNNKQNKGFRPS